LARLIFVRLAGPSAGLSRHLVSGKSPIANLHATIYSRRRSPSALVGMDQNPATACVIGFLPPFTNTIARSRWFRKSLLYDAVVLFFGTSRVSGCWSGPAPTRMSDCRLLASIPPKPSCFQMIVYESNLRKRSIRAYRRVCMYRAHRAARHGEMTLIGFGVLVERVFSRTKEALSILYALVRRLVLASLGSSLSQSGISGLPHCCRHRYGRRVERPAR
jgi:hypothetical protein